MIDYENFAIIMQFASQHGYSLPDAARLFLALPYAWTRVDRLVTAFLEVPLKAYGGRGNPARGTHALDRGTTWVPLQHNPATQLYIPGLVVRGQDGPQLYERAFPSPTLEYVAGNRRPAPAPKRV